MSAIVLGTLGAAGLSAASSFAINQANLKNQQAINDLNINLANTAHQREVADLRLAGLNPILSAHGNGAGGTAQASAQLENPLSGIDSVVGDAFSARQQRRLSQARVNQSEASADLSISTARQAEIENKIKREELKLLRAENKIALSPEGRKWARDKLLLEANPKSISHGFWSLLERLTEDGRDDNSAKAKSHEKVEPIQKRGNSNTWGGNPLKFMFDENPWSRMRLR